MSCEEHKLFGPIEILFDFLKNRKYNDYKRVASKRKSSLPAARFLLLKNNSVMKKCVALMWLQTSPHPSLPQAMQ